MKPIPKFILLCLLFTSLCAGASAILPDRKYRLRPEKLGLIYRNLSVTTPDGLKIKTWFYPAQPQISREESDNAWKNPVVKPYKVIGNKKRPTIIICNGDAGNMSYQQTVFAEIFTAEGYNVVTFDWRGFGESSEWPMNTDYLVYTELLIDYEAVIKEVLKQKEVDDSRIALFGWSTGAYLSMPMAGKFKNVKSFVAIGLMTTFDEVMPVLKRVPKNINRNLIVPADYPKELQPFYIAPTFKKPTFLIVGELDDRTPVWMSEKIYGLLPGTKELWILEGAQHGGPEGPMRDYDLLNQRILDFLGRTLK